MTKAALRLQVIDKAYGFVDETLRGFHTAASRSCGCSRAAAVKSKKTCRFSSVSPYTPAKPD